MLTGSCFFARFLTVDPRSPREFPSNFEAVCGRLAVFGEKLWRGWCFRNIFTGSDLRGVFSRLEKDCMGVVALASMGDLGKFPGVA